MKKIRVLLLAIAVISLFAGYCLHLLFPERKIDEKAYSIDVMADCNDPLYRQVKEALPENNKLSDYIASVNITTFKP